MQLYLKCGVSYHFFHERYQEETAGRDRRAGAGLGLHRPRPAARRRALGGRGLATLEAMSSALGSFEKVLRAINIQTGEITGKEVVFGA